VNEDGRVNGTYVVSLASGHRSVGGITEDDGVDLRWIVFVVGVVGSGCGAGPGSAGVVGVQMCMSVPLGIEDQEERTDGGHDCQQDSSGAERLADSR
jgi:hypothetical protein